MDEPHAWRPADIAWPEGERFVLLEGDLAASGPVSFASRLAAGVWNAPHWHSADIRVFVASGTVRLGYGDDGERERAVAYPVGSLLIVPAGILHFDGAEVETILFVTTIGPMETHPAR